MEVGVLTETGTKEGAHATKELLDTYDRDEIARILMKYPPRLRSLFLNLLLRDNEVSRGFYNAQLTDISNKVFDRVHLSIALSRYPFDILFGSVLRIWEYMADDLTLLHLGARDAPYHTTKEWKPKQSFDTCPEVADYLTISVEFNRNILNSIERDITMGISSSLSKMALLSVLSSKQLTRMGISKFDVETIQMGFNSAPEMLWDFVKELEAKEVVSGPDRYERFSLIQDPPLELINQLTDGAAKMMENWWSEEPLKRTAVPAKDAAAGNSRFNTQLESIARDGSDHDRVDILIDASEVARNNRRTPSITNIELARNFFVEQGLKVTVIADASLRHHIDKPKLFESFLNKNLMIQSPSGTSADELILQIAAVKTSAKIVSNDDYEDWSEKYWEVLRDDSRRIKYSIVDGRFHPLSYRRPKEKRH